MPIQVDDLGAGNPSRFQQGAVRIRVDNAWRTELDLRNKSSGRPSGRTAVVADPSPKGMEFHTAGPVTEPVVTGPENFFRSLRMRSGKPLIASNR